MSATSCTCGWKRLPSTDYEADYEVTERALPPAQELAVIRSELAGEPTLLQRIYAARGVRTASDLDLTTAKLLRPQQLKGSDVAARRICQAVQNQEFVLFVGDFDADGATASALGVSLLSALGAARVDFLVPNRFDFGYGLTPEIVAVALRDKPDLIITVDNGIASIAGVRCANEAGIDVVVTDHHLPGTELPAATAIVNPNQPGCEFPSKHLAGVGVIWYLLSAVRRELANAGWFESRAETQSS